MVSSKLFSFLLPLSLSLSLFPSLAFRSSSCSLGRLHKSRHLFRTFGFTTTAAAGGRGTEGYLNATPWKFAPVICMLCPVESCVPRNECRTGELLHGISEEN